MTTKISQREFITALAAAKRAPAAKRPPADRPVMAVSVDMRLTGNDIARLSADQVEAVFEGVGRLVAQGLGQ